MRQIHGPKGTLTDSLLDVVRRSLHTVPLGSSGAHIADIRVALSIDLRSDPTGVKGSNEQVWVLKVESTSLGVSECAKKSLDRLTMKFTQA